MKRRRPEKWMCVTKYGDEHVEYIYPTVEGAAGLACRLAGEGHPSMVFDPEGIQVANFIARKPRLQRKIKRDPNLGKSLQASAEKRRQSEKRDRLRRPGPKKKPTLTRRKA